MVPNGREPVSLLVATLLALALSGLAPRDRFTWLLEVMPILVAAPVLVATYTRFRFTPLAYRLIAVHALVLMIGGGTTRMRTSPSASGRSTRCTWLATITTALGT